MDFNDKLRDADKMLLDGYTGQAIVAAGRILEELLQHLYQEMLPKLKAADQQAVTQALERVAKGKAVGELTLGQLVGLFREAQLFEKCETALNRKVPRLRAADYTNLIDIRNRAAHAGSDEHIEEDDARLVVSQVRVFAREAGLLEPPPTARKLATGPLLRPWSRVVKLHADVASGQTAKAAYAIDLGALVAGDKKVPTVYREADAFFRATYPTHNMVALIEEVHKRLSGDEGDRVLQLRSPFGGGKSHVLAALYHATQDRPALEKNWPQAKNWPQLANVRVAVFDGEKFDVQGREVESGLRPQTLWGWIAYRLGGAPLYEEVRYHDEHRIAPGGDVIVKLLGRAQSPEPPTLIMLDEVLKYFERANAESVMVGQSTLGRQTLDFIQSLSTEVANSSHAVMIYSLQASAGEAFGNVALLNMLDHLTARVDAKREPVVGDEILPVLQRRLLSARPDEAVSEAVADSYANLVTSMRAANARTASEKRAAQDELLTLRKRYQLAYPFHPALIDLMKERWAAIPEFQRTRGALRFLSTALHALQEGSGLLLGPGDVSLSSGDVQNAFFTEVGQREPFKAVLEADLTGPNARARRIDERLASEYPHLSGVRPATRLATAILMYSFGGLRRAGEGDGEPIATGVIEPELLAAVIGPDLDGLTAQSALKALREECLFLHYDGVRYVFKTTPNVTQLLEQEFDNVKMEEAEAKIKEELEKQLSSRPAYVWPIDSMRVDDRKPQFTLVYLPLDFASWGQARQNQYALEILLKRGDQPRRYRNALGLAVPNLQEIESLRRAMRYALAVERLRGKKVQNNLTTEQMAQLKERGDTEKGKVESAFRNLYNAVWLPTANNGSISLEAIDIGARPLGATTIHERLMELLTTVQNKVYGTLKAHKLLEYMRLGESAQDSAGRPLGVSTNQIVDAFYENLGFPRLVDDRIIRRAIAQGVKDGYFGYVGRGDRVAGDKMREGSGYLVPRTQVVVNKDLLEDEIDLGSGFIVLPAAIEPEVVTPPVDVPPSEPEPPTGTGPVVPPMQPGAEQKTQTAQTHVELRLRLTRAKLYASFNALANLAEKAGAIEVSVTADSMTGFDPVWLRNAVREPLEEAGAETID